MKGRGGDAIDSDTHIDFVQIELHDSLFGKQLLNANGDHGFFDFALKAQILRKKKDARDLLRDRGSSNGTAVREIALNIDKERTA